MATTTAHNAIRYINDTTAQVTKAFEKKACIFGTEEFNLWREYKAMFPDAKMITKSIKKSEKQKKRRNRKFENMVEFIQTQPNAEELMAEYEYIQKRSKVQTSPYQYVLEWFEAKFKGYDDLEQFMNQKEEERKQKEAEATSNKPVATTAQND